MVGGENPRVRFGTLALVCLGLFAALFARLWYLQVLNADAYRVVATRNATRTRSSFPSSCALMRSMPLMSPRATRDLFIANPRLASTSV